MEERSGKPAKGVKVDTSSVGGFNINVRRGAPVAAKKVPLPPKPTEKEDPKTLADYVPPSIDDPVIDKAIDDIIVSESNEILAVEDSMYKSSEQRPVVKQKSKLKKLFTSKWLYIGLGIVIIAIFVWPTSRYLILSQFIKKDYQLTVIDSGTKNPISGATVVVGKNKETTNAYGRIELKLPLGKYKYQISKHFYADQAGSIFVGLAKPKASSFYLKATGRQVAITIVNKISGRLLAGVKISILNTTAITNSSGRANLVLPTKQSSYQAVITANGFNALVAPIQVVTSATANVLRVVPTGYIYYLSNTGGTINVVKANLDGSNPVTVVAGTGKETASSTKLYTSPDGKYLILESQRAGTQPELYVINTSSGNLTEFDSATDNFNIIGWSEDLFLYDEVATAQDTSSTGREQLKSYNAQTNQLNVLDQNQVNGSSPSYGYQSFANFELLPDLIVYTTSWTSVGSYDISSSNDTIRSVEPNGLNKKDYTTFAASTTGTISVVRNEPESLYIAVNNTSSSQTTYYSFSDGGLNPASISAATFATPYPTYYISPSGEASLWSTNQNSVTQVYTANQNGQNAKQLLVPNGYTAYGWYDNVYILFSNNGQLYIGSSSGSNKPIDIGSYLSS